MRIVHFMIERIGKLVYKMWEEALCICLGLSVFTNVFLIGYSITYEPQCERMHLEDINRKKDRVPSEEMAKGLAGASIGLEDDWEEQDNFFYVVECSYNEERYEWIVIFTPRDVGAVEKRVVGIRRDLGLITIYQ